MELLLHMLPLCCHPLNTGYFYLLEVLPRLDKLPKPNYLERFSSHLWIQECWQQCGEVVRLMVSIKLTHDVKALVAVVVCG